MSDYVGGRLIVGALVRNEAKKYWPSALAAWSEFADKIVVLDDGSTDKTLKIADACEKVASYSRSDDRQAWGRESRARADLWDVMVEESAPGDYLLWLDADMVPAGDPRELVHPGCDTYYFTLYDLWGEDASGRLLYREDAFWRGHLHPRVWMIRRKRDFRARWGERGVHCGHLPANWEPGTACFAPPSHALLHYAYFDERDRAAKHAQYLEVVDQLSVPEVAHARSIVDADPFCKPLLVTPKWTLTRAI